METRFQNRLPLVCLIQVKIIAMACWHRLGKLICTHQRPWVNIQAPRPHKWTGYWSARADSSQLTQDRGRQSGKSWLQNYGSLWSSQDTVIQQLRCWHTLTLAMWTLHISFFYHLIFLVECRLSRAVAGSFAAVISPLQQSLIGQT